MFDLDDYQAYMNFLQARQSEHHEAREAVRLQQEAQERLRLRRLEEQQSVARKQAALATIAQQRERYSTLLEKLPRLAQVFMCDESDPQPVLDGVMHSLGELFKLEHIAASMESKGVDQYWISSTLDLPSNTNLQEHILTLETAIRDFPEIGFHEFQKGDAFGQVVSPIAPWAEVGSIIWVHGDLVVKPSLPLSSAEVTDQLTRINKILYTAGSADGWSLPTITQLENLKSRQINQFAHVLPDSCWAIDSFEQRCVYNVSTSRRQFPDSQFRSAFLTIKRR
jgi:hypothetical protein